MISIKICKMKDLAEKVRENVRENVSKRSRV